jgi:hypothetical protein
MMEKNTSQVWKSVKNVKKSKWSKQHNIPVSTSSYICVVFEFARCLLTHRFGLMVVVSVGDVAGAGTILLRTCLTTLWNYWNNFDCKFLSLQLFYTLTLYLISLKQRIIIHTCSEQLYGSVSWEPSHSTHQ